MRQRSRGRRWPSSQLGRSQGDQPPCGGAVTHDQCGPRRRRCHGDKLVTGRVGEKLDIDFVISTGNNFYDNGLKGAHDHAFEESFSDIYTARSLQKSWYLVMGNHDYRGNALAQLSPVLQKINSRFICMRSFIVNAEIVDFFLVDTTPFQLNYWTHPGKHHYDWRGVALRGKYIANLLEDLDEAMRKSMARWKIVVGHHTMRSVSDHGVTMELLKLLLPILKENDMYNFIDGLTDTSALKIVRDTQAN